MSYLSFDEMAKVEGRKFEDLEVPELSGKIRLAELTAGKSLEFKKLQAKKERDDEIERKQMVLLLVGAVVDADGKPVLDAQKASLLIDRISFKSLNLIIEKVMSMMVPPTPEKKPEEAKAEGDPSGN